MVSSYFYIPCFIILTYNTSTQIRACSSLCIAHILGDNFLYWYFDKNLLSFDVGLYLTIGWCMDIALISLCLLILSGIRKKLLVISAGAVLIGQMTFLQFPYLNYYMFSINFTQGYYLFIECFILFSSLNTADIKNTIKSCMLVSTIATLHILY